MRTILRQISLLTGKNTGNFDVAGRAPRRKALPDSTLAGEQYLRAGLKQGMISEGTGKWIP
jgi:hypothetical protein